MKRLLIIGTALLFAACGLVSKYPNGQHATYAKMLTAEEKDLIRQKGEIVKDIEFNKPASNGLLKGTLRIIRTDDPDIFNFIEIGQWINHSRVGN